MCIFCAAVPMSAAIGAAMTGKQHQRREQVQANGETIVEQPIPMGKITVAVTGTLIACSAVYHLVIVPRTGVLI